MRYFHRRDMTKPGLLRSPEVTARRQEIDAYILSVRIKGGQRRAPFYQDILENTELADLVRQQFGNVCAYCERQTEQQGQVFHHRPPGLAADQSDRTQLLNYVWLIYDWENLYWVCADCARHKANRFYATSPTTALQEPIARLRETEGELLLDPCHHEVHNHLAFQPDGSVLGITEAGQATISLLDLDSASLRQARQDTNRRLAKLLGWEHALMILPTGLSNGPSDALLVECSPLGDVERPLPHIGAATLALLAWVGRHDSRVTDCNSLMSLLDDGLSRIEAQNLVERYRGHIEGTGFVTTMADPETSDAEPPQTSPKPPTNRLFNPANCLLSDARLETIRIRNFKALKSVDLTLPSTVPDSWLVPCAVILGENAAGKSSVLEAVTLALLGADETNLLAEYLAPRQEDISPRSMLHRPDTDNWDTVSADPLDITISYLGHTQKTALTAGAEDARYQGDPRPAKVLLAYGPRRYFSNRNTRRRPEPLYRVRSLFDPLATLPNPKSWLLGCDEKIFEAVVRALREVLVLDPEADLIREDRGVKNRRIMIETTQGVTPLDQLSEGYKSILAMATDIARALLTHYDNLENAYGVVLIDEIETHLHPRWKMQIVRRLRLAFPSVQFIITTHDPLCLRGMYGGEVFVLQRHPENRRVETLTGLPDVRGMRAEQILTSEFFGLGSTDPETEAKLIRFQALLLREERNLLEVAEMQRLQEEISQTMKVGDTVLAQTVNEAMVRADIDPFATIGKIGAPSRKRMVEDLLSAMQDRDVAPGDAETPVVP